MAGTVGLTEVQQAEYEEFKKRKNGGGKPLTPKMEETLSSYQNKLNNPELPQGAKTYCKKWLKEHLYRRRTEVHSKYITKGNLTEEDGFTLMAVELKLGMVYKNEQYRENEYSTGTWDLMLPGVVYDNKSCWSLDTFPMFDVINPKPEYDWQLQIYTGLADVPKGVVVFTLNNAPEIQIQKEIRWIDDHQERARIMHNMVFTQEYWDAMKSKYCAESELKFVPIPQSKRVKTFSVIRDNLLHYKIKERVRMCNQYINSLI